MSATGRSIAAGTGYVRHPDDYFSTPGWATRAILPFLPLSGKIFEPAAGEGAIIAEILRFTKGRADVWGGEIDQDRTDTANLTLVEEFGARIDGLPYVHRGDALDRPWSQSDLVVTNPPFALAMEFVQRFHEWVTAGATMAMLLRLNWLSSQKRARWLRENTPSVYVLPRRPSFTGNGTDSADYGWFVWSPSPSTVRILDVESTTKGEQKHHGAAAGIRDAV